MADNETGGAAPLVDQVKQQAQQAVQQGQGIAGQAVEQAKSTVKGQLSTQKDNLAGMVDSVAQVLQQATQTLKDQNQPALGEYGDKAAAEVTKVSDYLKNKQFDEIVSDVNDFGKANPVVFLSIAAVLGAVAARFLKSSGSAVAAPSTSSLPDPASSAPVAPNGGGYYANAPASPTVADYSHTVPSVTGMGEGPVLHGVDVGDPDYDEIEPTHNGLDYIEAADATGSRMSNDL